MSHFKEKYNSGTFRLLLHEVAEAFVEDDLLLPLGDDGFVLLEVKWLSHDGEDVVHGVLLVKRGDRPMAVKNTTGKKT